MCFFWGFQDSAVNTHSQEILGFEFTSATDDHNSSADPYAAFYFSQSMACFVIQLLQSFVVTQTDFIIYSAAMGLFGVMAMLFTYLAFGFKQPTQKNKKKGKE
jgi:hypothetical protein